VEIKVKKLNPEAKLPQYAHPGDAGMDLFSLEEVIIKPGEIIGIKTGIAVEIPHGFVGLFWDKSGLSIKHGLKVMGGVIDASYRGELIVGMKNLGEKEYVFEKGHKVAQMLIQQVDMVDIVEAQELTDTSRGEGGFGSTGKQ
jgi:dUTP pyrophosphatase